MNKFEYDVIVIGGGAAGLTASGMAASLGAKTGLIEEATLGGDCTWTGCVPSKALIRIAKTAREIALARSYGINVNDWSIDFSRVISSIHSVREDIYQKADSPERLAKHNVEVILGRASFMEAHKLKVETESGEKVLTSRYIVICTGATPRKPKIKGVPSDCILTNESLFELERLPQRLAIVGGGSIGVEMGQAFQRLGSEVTIIERDKQVLMRYEEETRNVIEERLLDEGVRLLTQHSVLSGEVMNGETSLNLKGYNKNEALLCDRIFGAIGRIPNISRLQLDNVGVAYSNSGIEINHSCQTSVPHIYACGDVAQGPDFTHVAENMAKTAISRILLKIPATWERDVLPTITFSDPEIASVGLTSVELDKHDKSYNTIRFPYSHIDRARIERKDEGVIIVHYRPLSGKILGAHIVGTQAGEMIHEFVLAMKGGLSLRDISKTVHAYPSWSQGVRRTADHIYLQNGSKGAVRGIARLFGYRGNVSSLIGSDEVI